VHRADAIVVGGGPAGSTCAWKLREAGLDVTVLDREVFPRNKLCAGWVTPAALRDLEIEPQDYPLGIVTFERLCLHWKALSLGLTATQHSIRRVEFDDFLLRRSGARVVQHQVRDIRSDGDDYVIDGEYRCRYLVGAGGTRCPVYKTVFHHHRPRSTALQTATLEQEFHYDWEDERCHLWFFGDGLPGYAWYVPKANGYINVGLGGMAEQIKRRNGHLQDYWRRFVERLAVLRLVRYDDYRPNGYSYYLRGLVGRVSDGNAFLVGDAAGLATHDLCEGIGPAVRSGLLAAASIVNGTEYSLDEIDALSGNGAGARLLARSFAGSAAVASERGDAQRGNRLVKSH